MQVTDIHAVHGLLTFGQHGSDRTYFWTADEMASIITVMEEVNEALRVYFGCRSAEPCGTHVGWNLSKTSGKFGPRYIARLWTWEVGAYGGDTAQAIAAKMRAYYAWCLTSGSAHD